MLVYRLLREVTLHSSGYIYIPGYIYIYITHAHARTEYVYVPLVLACENNMLYKEPNNAFCGATNISHTNTNTYSP